MPAHNLYFTQRQDAVEDEVPLQHPEVEPQGLHPASVCNSNYAKLTPQLFETQQLYSTHPLLCTLDVRRYVS
eukprot:4745063-Amphidinium_carterae.1